MNRGFPYAVAGLLAAAIGDSAVQANSIGDVESAERDFSDHNGQYVPMESYDENNARNNDWHESSVFLSYLTGDQSALDRNKKVTTEVPLSVLDPIVVRAKQRLWKRVFASYGYNQQSMPAPKANTDRSFKVGQVTNPSRTAAFMTATDWKVLYAARFRWLDNPVEGKTTDQRMAYRHGNKAVVVYYDGSSGLVSPADIRSYDTKGGANHPFWKANH